MHAAIRACLEDAGVTGLVDKLTASPTAEVQVDAGDNQSTPCHYWGGKFRRVQSDFALPDCSVRQMWMLWVCGNKSKQIPPHRQLDGRDMPSRKLKKAAESASLYYDQDRESCCVKELTRNDSQNVDEAMQVFVVYAESVDIDKEQNTRESADADT
ncbi:hypothetical protein P3T76_008550 [Phytophthora citrophthora]|uniref:Uncharacterized protein n=1 Tax=Phytophthora citrophthora TaxID=4793 RepID=A0AAD9GJD2_9STRA|nr:hypothetical protein P3T76_008550 [Phytophthora citrophthora]